MSITGSIRAAICLLFLPLHALLAASHPVEFVVVVPSYNNEKWVIGNLDSIMSQTYPHFSVLYLNDASSDSTGTLVDEYIKSKNLGNRIQVIHNTVRKGATQNIYDGVHLIGPKKVVVLVDGDDKLARKDALDIVASHYKNPHVWMTYGDFATDPVNWGSCCEEIPKFILKTREFRRYRWVTSHLKTFYAKLFHKIKKEDLLWKGQFFPMTSDLAIFFPLLEMASRKHIRFVRETLYTYNVTNPLNDYRVNSGLQQELDLYIRSMPPYKSLKTLF